MSKSFTSLTVIGVLALIGSTAYAAEPAQRRLNTVTFTQSISPANAASASRRAAKNTGVSLGSWAKVDGLDTTWDVVESRADAKTLASPAKGSGNDIAVERITNTHEGFRRP